MKWRTSHDKFIAENAHKGAEWCRDGLARKFGVNVTVSALKRHAYRAGISLKRYEVCPECERMVTRLVAGSGLCRECHMRGLARRTSEVREAIEDAADRREYKANQMWFERHYEEIVSLSQKMSQRRSGKEKQ